VEGQPAAPRRAHRLFYVIHKYTRYKLIFVGDSTMSPYEILYPGGSVEHWNEEPARCGSAAAGYYPRTVWLNPEAEQRWTHTASIQTTLELLGDNRMFPLTLSAWTRHPQG